jgi:hypothetical protein
MHVEPDLAVMLPVRVGAGGGWKRHGWAKQVQRRVRFMCLPPLKSLWCVSDGSSYVDAMETAVWEDDGSISTVNSSDEHHSRNIMAKIQQALTECVERRPAAS